MSGDPRSNTPAWRKGVKTPEKKQAAQPGWKKEAEKPITAGRVSRKTKLGVGALLLLFFSALLFWVITWFLPAKQPALVLLGADHVDNPAVPANPYGWQSLTALAELDTGGGADSLWKRGGLVHLYEGPKELGEGDWAKGLDGLRQKVLIVYVAAHGGADGQGPYLLRQDAPPGELGEANRIRLDVVLKRLEQLAERKKVVLLLDTTGLAAHWPLGMLRNDFARKLREQAEAIAKIPNLAVICASDEDQRSWPDEEHRRTIFAHYVIEGLRGAADADRDRRVTVGELHAYVKDNVQRWARANRLARQTPMLLASEAAKGIELTLVSGEVAPETAEAPDLTRPEFAAVWQSYERLAKQVPPPGVYTPHLWRAYLDSFLRHEQLVRAGDTRRLPVVKARLEALEGEIEAARRLGELESARYSLAMPAALGLTVPWSREQLDDKLKALTTAADNSERSQRWEALSKDVPAPEKVNRQLLQVKLSALLLEQARQDPRENLDKVDALLGLINGGNNERPAEVHFLRMFAQNLKGSQRPDARLQQKALEVRLLAENTALAVRPELAAHPYSEYVSKWIQKRVEDADKERQYGQDHLFAANDVARRKAAELLAAAEGAKPEEGYQGAQQDGDAVRDAWQTANEVLLALPYYSQWLARRQPPDPGQRSAIATQVKTVEDLWENVHYLVRLLDTGNTEYINKDVRLLRTDPERGLRNQTKYVREAFQGVEERFLNQCRDLANNNNKLQSVWRDIDDVLTVPFIPADLRFRLLTNLRDISRALQRASADPKKIGEDEISAEDNAARARESARFHGQLVLATLGQTWFNDSRISGGEEFAAVRNTILARDNDDLLKAGDQINLRWRKMPEEISRRLNESRKTNLKAAAEELKVAERLTRLLDGGSVRTGADNAVQEARRFRLYDLLLWQAQRTLQDHWWGEDPTGERYYQIAGGRFVQDARALVEGAKNELGQAEQVARLARADELQKQIEAVALLDPRRIKPAALNFTEESQPRLEYVLGSKGEMPPGFPALWMDSNDPALVLREPAAGRMAVDLVAKQPLPFAFEHKPVADASVAKRTPEATLRGFYRGEPIKDTNRLTVYLRPDIVAYHLPDRGRSGIAVRADDLIHERFQPNRGAISIVLDCSGSMGPWDGLTPEQFAEAVRKYNRATPCRFHRATDSLRKVMQELPDGVTVSIFIFSHATLFRDGLPQDDITQPELTIQPVRLEGVNANGPAYFTWKQAITEPLMARLESLVPYAETPLFRAIVKAKDEGFPPNFSGFKTLLVLTDGRDNRFDKDKDLQDRQKTADKAKFLKQEFDKRGTVVNLVGFEVAQGEEKDLQLQFENTLKELDPPGRFYTTSKVAELTKVLQKFSRQSLRFKLERADGSPVPSPDEEGWEVSRREGADQWVDLEPGSYYVRVQTSSTLRQLVHVERGDYLLVNVRQEKESDRFGFERVLYGNDFKRWWKEQEREGSVMSLLQNRYDDANKSLELLLALENSSNRFPKRDTGTLQQLRPRLQAVWLEVGAAGADLQPTLLSWGEFPGFPAPTWRLSLRGWPPVTGTGKPATPAVQAWWNWDNEVIPLRTLERTQGAAPSDFEGRKVPLGQEGSNEVVIESVQVVTRDIEVAPGEPYQTGVTCLVVRASYPPNNPVWLDPYGLDIKGRQHRYYAQAGKYAGVFWPVTRDAVQTNLKGLSVISVDRFKKAEGTMNAEIKGDGPNQDPRPKTVPEKLPGAGKP